MHLSQHWLRDTLGAAYVVASTALGFVGLGLLQPYMANDYLWAAFNDSMPVVTGLLNLELTVPTDDFDLFGATYLATDPSLGVQAAYGRKIMLQQWTQLDVPITALRTMNAADVGSIVTIYCWADLERRWELAFTSQRQARCVETMSTNAAVYLEAVLRNVDLPGWLAMNRASFMAHIGQPIVDSGAAGEAWLSTLLQHDVLSVEAEATVWMAHGLVKFQLQFFNWYRYGVTETLAIENALGMTWAYAINTVSVVAYFNPSCLLLNDLLLPDLEAIGADQSLVRNMPTSSNTTASLVEIFIMGFDLSPLNHLLHDSIGSMGNIDAWWVSPPSQLISTVRSFRSLVLHHITNDAKFAAAVAAIAAVAIQVTPHQWADPSLRFYGGNFLCSDTPLLPTVQESFGFYSICGAISPLSVQWQPWNALFAFAMIRPTNDSICDLGASPTQAETCRAIFTATSTTFQLLPPMEMAPPTAPVLQQIGYSQVVSNQSNLILQMQQLLDPTYAFFGWMSLYDWAMNQREVIAIVGDVSTITVMSPLYPSVSQHPITAVAALGPYLWSLAAVASVVLALVMVLVLGIWSWNRPCGTHWFLFPRLVSSVWLSRSILVTRSLIATGVLATAPMITHSTHGTLAVTSAPRSPWVSLVLANEATWLVYVFQEILSPLVRGHQAAPIIAWIAVAILDIATPVTVDMTVSHECTIPDIIRRVECTIGTIRIGSFPRTVTIVAILVAASLLVQPHRTRGRWNLLLPGTAAAYLTSTVDLDCATAAMCGVFVGSHDFLFDIKLWLRKPQFTTGVLDTNDARPNTVGKLRSLQSTFIKKSLQSSSVVHSSIFVTKIGPWNLECPVNVPVKQGLQSSQVRRQRRLRACIFVAGIGYLGVTLGSNLVYVSVIQEALSNDFGWADFNTTGHYMFLANLFNDQFNLGTAATPDLPVASPKYGDFGQLFDGTSTTLMWYEGAVWRLLYDPERIVLAEVIVGLRSMDPCQLPWMFTQYCWLDFGQQWEMASSGMRQQRCARQQANGAVYVEAALRNVNDWAAWQICWGASFDVAVREQLAISKPGQAWLATTTGLRGSIDAEVAYWSDNGISTFVLQWQNFKTTAFSDAFVITTALGMQYTMSTSSAPGAMHLDAQTSLRMYWSWANDLLAVADNSSAIGGYSLLRGSANFAFANTTSQALLQMSQQLPSPLTAGLTLVTQTVGPFGVVDTIYIPCPPALLAYYGSLKHELAALLLTNTTAQAAYLALAPPLYIGDIVPGVLTTANVLVTGGNLMCDDDSFASQLTLNVYASFGTSYLCPTQIPEYLTPTVFEIALAMHAFNSSHTVTTPDLEAVVALDPFATAVSVPAYGAFYSFLDDNVESLPAWTVAQSAWVAVNAANISLVQFILANGTTRMLYQTPLFVPSQPYWTFYAWCLVYEWAAGIREVVSFQGDVGTVTTMSAIIGQLSVPLDTALVANKIAMVFLGSVYYVTYVIIAVTIVAMGYTLVSRGRIESLNLFELNRIVGHVWVGRPLLILRSVTALWLLNTKPLVLSKVGLGTHLTAPPVAWYKSILAASELTWVVYILNDVLSCFTQQHTATYAAASSVCVCFITAVWTLVSPHSCTVTLDRTCAYVNMDGGMDCTSGVIAVGSVTRIWADLAIVLGCVVLCATIDMKCRPGVPPLLIPTLLLNASSYYMLDFTHWRKGSDFFLDQTSGVLSGLLTLHWKGTLYIFDVKNWRFVSLVVDASDESMASSIPLSRIG
ncbi:hypothetical protein DYB34_010246 [Aphanomyces astaci]|uniref:Uncharacterized protein n=1 Tax=Aphanomyces astaci TaxID=112090 RepID=A0A418BMW0_APHAT|nr:hypothetical protein DYB34_010246 [Aphanomyces astaci]